jgi:hypothetical protein
MRLAIHAGSYSIDNNNISQAQINAFVNAIVAAIPNCTHIAYGVYLDYPVQFQRWQTAIHNAGKKAWFRHVGYNEWQGKNSVSAVTTSTALSNYRTNVQSFIAANASYLQSGDIFSPVPDEPENGSYLTTLTIDSGSGQTTYNNFITGSITDVNTALASAGKTGITTNIVGTAPYHSRNSITSATAAQLDVMLIDAYPEGGGSEYPFRAIVDPSLCAQTTENHIARWITGSQGGKTYHYTLGPSIYTQLEEGVQAEAYARELFIIQKKISSLDGITVWQAGGGGDPTSRIFDYNSGNWRARTATKVINTYFGALINNNNPFKRISII